MKNPLVTISVPVFKCEDFIEKTLNSILKQTYPNFEVILVNDKTPDNSAEIAEKFIAKHHLENSWVIAELETNSGLSVVRNKGIELAKGKYIFFVDSDDEILPDAIENLVALAESENAELTMGEVEGIRLPEEEKVDIFPITAKENVLKGNTAILKAFVRGKFAVSSWNKLIRTDFLRKNNLLFTQGLYAQDSLHTFEMAIYLDSVAFLRKKTYRYFLHQNSVIHNRKKIHFDNWITIAQKINGCLLKEKNSERKVFIMEYLINFKSMTLQMNWKAQKNEELWKRSYKAYSQLKGLSFSDYFSSDYSADLKKKNLFVSLPVNIGFQFFKWRYER
ncbi:MAG: glycosyltransferase [Bergeyella sp.]